MERVNLCSPGDDALVEMFPSLRAPIEASGKGIDEVGDRQFLGLRQGFYPFDEIRGGHEYSCGRIDRTTHLGKRSLPDARIDDRSPPENLRVDSDEIRRPHCFEPVLRHGLQRFPMVDLVPVEIDHREAHFVVSPDKFAVLDPES